MFVGSARLPGSVLEHWQFEGQFSGFSLALSLCGGQHCCTNFWPHWNFNSEGAFVGGLKGDHLAQIAIQQSLLVTPARLGVCGRHAKVFGTRASTCAHDDVWAVGFAFTALLFSVLWSDFCEEQVCLHVCYQLVHELDREVGMY